MRLTLLFLASLAMLGCGEGDDACKTINSVTSDYCAAFDSCDWPAKWIAIEVPPPGTQAYVIACQGDKCGSCWLPKKSCSDLDELSEGGACGVPFR